MTLTKTQQQVAVDQGLALGARLLGVESVEWVTITTEGNFRRAWANWPQSENFPQIRAGLPINDLRGILRDSASRRGVKVAGWTSIRRGFAAWVEDDAPENLSDIAGVPAAEWVKLVNDWLNPVKPSRTLPE